MGNRPMKKKPTKRKPKVYKKAKQIAYVAQPKTSKAIKEKAAFTAWLEKERMRLAHLPPELEFDKEYKAFKKEEEAHRKALFKFEQGAQKEKQEQMRRVPMFAALEERKLELFSYKDHELSPFKTSIYSSAPAVQSSLIYQCPDLEHWSAWFGNDEVTLSQHSRLWFPGDFFTGKFIVWTRLELEGLVAIESGGKVQVDAACYVSLVQCTADDREHDGGWHYDPEYDTLLQVWSSYCDGPYPLNYEFTQQGLYSINPIEVALEVESTSGASNRFIEITQYLTITAENADVQFGRSRSDCSGGAYGWIHTPFPVVQLQYYNPTWTKLYYLSPYRIID